MKQIASIKHLPYGISPYDAEGFERVPADPEENDFIIIKSIVEPHSDTHEVLLEWTLNGVCQPHLEAVTVYVDGDRAYYRFELGRFFKDDTITYFIEVRDRGNLVRTKEFSFVILSGCQADKIEDIKYRNNSVELSFSGIGAYNPKMHFTFNMGDLRIQAALTTPPGRGDVGMGVNTCSFQKMGENEYLFTDMNSGNNLRFFINPFMFVFSDRNGNVKIESDNSPFSFLTLTGCCDGGIKKVKLRFKTNNDYYYGFGERFNRVNQNGLNPDMYVFEQFTNQKEKTYMPIPFFFTEKEYGMFLNSSFYSRYALSSKAGNLLEIECKAGYGSPLVDLYIFTGRPAEIINKYLKITGYPALPPRWAFGPWMSSNRWNSQEETIKQAELTRKYEIPATVIVLEAWSDEATFYIFNDAQYKPGPGAKTLRYNDFRFGPDSKWPDPKGLMEYLHGNDLKIVLWQIPVVKYFEDAENNQHAADEELVVEKKYCVLNADGTPYKITYNWFCNSLLLDFTNPQAREWWFEKRKYLLEDLKVDGFKTDGGEFIFDDGTVFHNGKTGCEMRNLYPEGYISAYHDFIGKERVTFSRAGFAGAQKYPLYWAGDQASSFEEFRCVLRAGLSANISGNPFWGYDIAGFAGKMPSSELYIRSTQMAVFCPVMQYHSAPPEGTENNDRTPWNVARFNNDARIIGIYRRYANLRMNLLPYVYHEASYVAENGEPFMRALIVDYPDDPYVYDIEDEYLFGRSLLIAPILEDSCRRRKVYLPEGQWVDFRDGAKFNGNNYIEYQCDIDSIPVFIKNNSVIPLNLNNKFEIGGNIGNETDKYTNLCFMVIGELNCVYEYGDDLGVKVTLEQKGESVKAEISGDVNKIYMLRPAENMGAHASTYIRFNNFDCQLYEYIK